MRGTPVFLHLEASRVGLEIASVREVIRDHDLQSWLSEISRFKLLGIYCSVGRHSSRDIPDRDTTRSFEFEMMSQVNDHTRSDELHTYRPLL